MSTRIGERLFRFGKCSIFVRSTGSAIMVLFSWGLRMTGTEKFEASVHRVAFENAQFEYVSSSVHKLARSGYESTFYYDGRLSVRSSKINWLCWVPIISTRVQLHLTVFVYSIPITWVTCCNRCEFSRHFFIKPTHSSFGLNGSPLPISSWSDCESYSNITMRMI